MQTRVALCVSGMLAFAIAGCTCEAKQASTPNPTPVKSEQADEAEAKAPPAPVEAYRITSVVLSDAGAAPHRIVRYAFTDGHSARGALLTETTFAIRMDGEMRPMPKPPATVRVRFDTIASDATRATRRLSVEDMTVTFGADAPRGLMSDVSSNLGALKQLAYGFGIDTQGRFEAATLAEGSGDDPRLVALMTELQQTLGRLAVVFPEEPIGVGATWEIRARFTEYGIDLDERTTMKLVALDEDGGRVEVTSKTIPVSPPKNPFGIPESAAPKLQRFLAEGKGVRRFHRVEGILEGEHETAIDAVIQLRRPDIQERIAQDVSIGVKRTFTPGAPSEPIAGE